MWPYGALWILLGILALLTEGAALRRVWARGGTLSELVWGWVGVRSGHWTWRRWLLLAFLAWLTGHLVMGWWSL